ncbi:hypothetical protein PHPALM_29269 [Phytophthora palmivora]|uniref:Uncharacterized protein n=1 Tax=Phytophthora palmivora TaxID=4796 RepID=A0A2P4X805_9STRA|nr:hypothetical protein PHPALM_29269 [Phytophthora palmivora]
MGWALGSAGLMGQRGITPVRGRIDLGSQDLAATLSQIACTPAILGSWRDSLAKDQFSDQCVTSAHRGIRMDL